MFAPRLTASGLIYSAGDEKAFIYAVGGNKTQHCERFDVGRLCWELIPDFKDKVEAQDTATGYANCLFTYGMCGNIGFFEGEGHEK